MKQPGTFEDMLAQMKACATRENAACLSMGRAPIARIRIMEFIADNPVSTAEHVARALGLSPVTVQSELRKATMAGVLARSKAWPSGPYEYRMAP